jgi:hypothetical protein
MTSNFFLRQSWSHIDFEGKFPWQNEFLTMGMSFVTKTEKNLESKIPSSVLYYTRSPARMCCFQTLIKDVTMRAGKEIASGPAFPNGACELSARDMAL